MFGLWSSNFQVTFDIVESFITYHICLNQFKPNHSNSKKTSDETTIKDGDCDEGRAPPKDAEAERSDTENPPRNIPSEREKRQPKSFGCYKEMANFLQLAQCIFSLEIKEEGSITFHT